MTDKSILLSDTGLRVEILPEEGARISAFWTEEAGRRIDWFVPRSAVEEGSTAWGSFPLVPFSNRIRDGRFDWMGEHHRIAVTPKSAPHAIHGHGRDRSWLVEDRSATHVTLAYDYTGDDWPFAYHARQEFALVDGALRISMSLRNDGTTKMPGGLGHHPYLPWRSGGPVLESGLGSIWPAIDGVLPRGADLVPAKLDFSEPGGRALPRGLDTGFGGWTGAATVTWPEEGCGLEISGSDGLGHVILFSPDGMPHFCFEPVTHAIDAINLAASGVRETGLQSIEPGESMAVEMGFRPLSGGG